MQYVVGFMKNSHVNLEFLFPFELTEFSSTMKPCPLGICKYISVLTKAP